MNDTKQTDQPAEVGRADGEGAGAPSRWQLIREGRSYILTVLVGVLMAFLAIIIYLLEYWPMQFLYTMF